MQGKLICREIIEGNRIPSLSHGDSAAKLGIPGCGIIDSRKSYPYQYAGTSSYSPKISDTEIIITYMHTLSLICHNVYCSSSI